MPGSRRPSSVARVARALVAAFLMIVVAGCTAAVPAPLTATPTLVTASAAATRTPTVAPATPLPLATSTATTYATACGMVSDFVKTTLTTDGSVVLNSPGRTPLKITLTVARNNPEGQFGGYVCIGLDAGVPYPIFAGIGVPRVNGLVPESYVPEGTYPATLAKPAPAGFVVPQACAYIRPPEVGGDQTNWWVDCGTQLNRDARGTLGAALAQQGWTGCGPALGTMLFFKGTTRIVVVESSLAPGDYPRFSQLARPGTGCS